MCIYIHNDMMQCAKVRVDDHANTTQGCRWGIAQYCME